MSTNTAVPDCVGDGSGGESDGEGESSERCSVESGIGIGTAHTFNKLFFWYSKSTGSGELESGVGVELEGSVGVAFWA